MTKRGWTRRSTLFAAGAVAACTQDLDTPPYDGTVAFNHGVASGDPKKDRVIIWTRVTPENAGPVPVRWIVARNRELTDVVKTGIINAVESRDYTVKIDVTNLRAGAPYFYGFRAGQASSPVGKTKTLPQGEVAHAKIAVVSCASYPHGFFNVYEAMARRNDIDVVVHLGDYIYEYGISGYGGDVGMRLGRTPAPEVECIRLEDYRARHAQCKSQSEVQSAHAIAPWVVVWDDHEVANDSWSTGAENHQPNEGEWANRKRAALQAYYEWMPIREPESGRAFEAINRSFDYGDLFTLIMLETRLLARTKQLDYAHDLPILTQRWNFTNPSAPVALRPTEADTAQMQRLPAIFEAAGGEMRPVYDWRRAQGLIAAAPNLPAGFYLAPDVERLSAELNTPDRQLMGPAQEQWFAGELTRSKREGRPWQIVGNQVIMAPVSVPDLSATPPQLSAALEQLRPGVTQLLKLTKFPFPLDVDAWDGYPGPRARALQAMRAAGGNTIVVTGDSHMAWANELNDGQGRVAVEFGGTSVTSPSDASYFSAAGIDFAAGIRARNPHIKWTDASEHGYLLVSLTRQQATAEFFTVSNILSKEYQTGRAAAFTVNADDAPGIGAITPVAT